MCLRSVKIRNLFAKKRKKIWLNSDSVLPAVLINIIDGVDRNRCCSRSSETFPTWIGALGTEANTHACSQKVLVQRQQTVPPRASEQQMSKSTQNIIHAFLSRRWALNVHFVEDYALQSPQVETRFQIRRHVQKCTQVAAVVMVGCVGQYPFSNGHVVSICRRLLHLRDFAKVPTCQSTLTMWDLEKFSKTKPYIGSYRWVSSSTTS